MSSAGISNRMKEEQDKAMGGTMSVIVREMTMEDYDKVYALWLSIQGFGIRSIDDSREGVERFLRRNPTTSVVAEQNGRIVGAILCGHDGRRGCFYHVWQRITASMEWGTEWRSIVCGRFWQRGSIR